MPDLKPCPLCGGKAKLYVCAISEDEGLSAIIENKYGVYCTKCHIETTPMESANVAIKAWNRRFW